MNTLSRLASVSALALIVASPAISQSRVVGIEDLDDRIEDVQEDIDDDINEGADADRFGNNQYAQGWSGSASAGLTATDGNTDTVDLNIAGRLRYGNGPWNHSIGFLAEVAEDNNVRNKEEAFLTYEANRYVTENAYIFGLGSVAYDGFDTNKWDVFLGFGPGYRIVNTPTTTWRVQAGPGVRYIEDQAGNDTTEVAGIASSRVFHSFSETAFLTNDTDVLFSDDNTTIVNDIGVTFKMTQAVATRVGLRTTWDSDPLPGRDDTDNSLNVSLVVGF